jgi:hypothetical protein
MRGQPRKNPLLTTDQINALAMAYITSSELTAKDLQACGINRNINHDERDMVYRRVESLGTELLTKYIKPNPYVEYKEYR